MECLPLRSPPGAYHYHVTDQTKSLQVNIFSGEGRNSIPKATYFPAYQCLPDNCRLHSAFCGKSACGSPQWCFFLNKSRSANAATTQPLKWPNTANIQQQSNHQHSRFIILRQNECIHTYIYAYIHKYYIMVPWNRICHGNNMMLRVVAFDGQFMYTFDYTPGTYVFYVRCICASEISRCAHNCCANCACLMRSHLAHSIRSSLLLSIIRLLRPQQNGNGPTSVVMKLSCPDIRSLILISWLIDLSDVHWCSPREWSSLCAFGLSRDGRYYCSFAFSALQMRELRFLFLNAVWSRGYYNNTADFPLTATNPSLNINDCAINICSVANYWLIFIYFNVVIHLWKRDDGLSAVEQ